ncbi:energy-coupling factor transporter transmembrane component T family protein [Candidatus Cloacimonadota bacterium]
MKLNLRTILILVLLTTSLSVIFQDLLMQFMLILFTIALYAITGTNRSKILRIFHRMKRLGQIILTVMIFQILFRQEGDVYWQFGIIKITSVGLSYGLTSSLRFFLIILIAGLLFDFPYYDYLLSFKSWKFPYEISFMVASIIHFIPIFSHQFNTSLEALALRGIDVKKIPIFTRFRMFVTLIFPVVAKAISNVRYRAISLELRGFRIYKERTYLYLSKLSWLDICLQAAGFVGFILILIFQFN